MSPLAALASTVTRLLVACCAIVAAAVVAPGGALAAGTPDIALAVDAQDTVVYGESSTVKLTTTNPPGSTGYNLSYRVVLPAGVSYVSSSAGAAAGEPSIISNQPATNQTTLLWKNVADVGASSSHVLDFRVQHQPLSFVVAQSFTITASAYVGSDDRYPPQFTAAGLADSTVPNPFTGSAVNVSDASTIAGMEVTRRLDDTPEGKLLRGVHTQQAVATVAIRNNALAPVTNFVVDDYLPAGLEFLGGCGGALADHTTNAPTNPGSTQEYPGAGAIPVAALAGCVEPTYTETLTVDPPGPAPLGVYTHLRWSTLGTLSAGTTVTLKYRVAVPLRANTTTWSNGLPNALTNAQAANLDNNSGAETADGSALSTYTRAQGDYNNTVFTTALGQQTSTVEDLTIKKTAQAPATLAQGAENQWDLTVRTSEYRSAANVVVTDTVPDGLCPVSAGTNYTQAPQDAADLADCGAGPDPSESYASVTENSSGTFTVVWDSGSVPALAELPPNATQAISFTTRARTHYQEAFAEAGPLLSRDTVTNAASASASARVICNGGVACPGGAPTGNEIANSGTLTTAVSDASSAEIAGATPTIDKRVADTSSDCSTATYSDGSPAPSYRPGDRICWKLRIDYPSALDTNGLTVSDYFPSTVTFDTTFGTAGDDPTGNDTLPGASFDTAPAIPGPGGLVQWTLPGSYVPGAQVFEHRVTTRVGLPTGAALGDVSTNVLRSSTQNTAGDLLPLRDSAPFRLSMPVMSTQKRVLALDGATLGGGAGVATQVVRGGQTVTYRVRLTNAGDQTAEQVEAWDPLPAGVTCADVTASAVAISDAGVCDNNIIKWGASPAIGPDVPSAVNKDLTYAFVVPTTIEPTQGLTSSAGIRRFQTPTNTGGTFTYVPGSNVDPTQNPSANIVSAKSAATITGAVPTITKARTSSITESSSGIDWNDDTTATIGETIHYTVTATLPAGVTVRDLELTDAIDPRQTYVASTLTQTAGPAATVGITGGNAISVALPSSYTAPTGTDTTLAFTFDTVVPDTTNNYRTTTDLTNSAKLLYTPPGTVSGGARTTTNSNTVSTTIVEPALAINKTADVGTSPVVGNDIVEYTVTITNGLGAASPAHETTLTDLVPTDLTPLNAAGDPISNGESTLGGGVWNDVARTLTFSPSATIYPGQTESFVYRVRVNDPATGGKNLTNTATATTTSLAGTVAGERTQASARNVGYLVSKSNTLSVLTPSVTKAVADTTLTIGQRTTYTVDVTIPRNTINYDVTVKDILPPSLDFDSFTSATCTAGCSTGALTPTIQSYTPVINPSDKTITLAWDLGDLTTQASVDRTVRLVYGVHLRATNRFNGTNVVRPQTAVNSVRVMGNRTDKVGAFAAGTIPAGPFDDTSAAATKTITVTEPAFAVDKQIGVNAGAFGNGPVAVVDGDTLKYRLVVTNTGNAPAYDVAVTDLPNAEINTVTMASGTSTTWVSDAWSTPGDDIKWTIPGPIAPGATATIDYTAKLPAVTSISDGDNFDNTAQVTQGWGVPLATRTADGALAPTTWSQFLFRSYTSPTDLTRATFDSPTLTVAKTTGGGAGPTYPESANVELGQTFAWRVKVTNTASAASATALKVDDVLPPNWQYIAGSANFSTGGAIEPAVVSSAGGDQLSWATSVTLAPGASTTLTYTARPLLASRTTPGIGAGNPHVNSAGASAKNGVGNPSDQNGAFVGATDTAQAILAVPLVTISQTPDNGPYAPGQTVPFQLTLENTGLVSATNVVVTDNFPGALGYTAGTATAAPATGFTETAGSASAATWRVASIAPGASVVITVPLKIDPATPAGTVTNTASVLTDQTVNSVADTGSVMLTPSADLTATKSASPNPATAGNALAYTLGVSNAGPSVAQDVVLTDVLPASVTFVSASPACAYDALSRTVTCTYTGATAVGASHTATINTTVATTAASANNSVTASAATSDPVTADNTATVAVPVGAETDLSLTKTASVAAISHFQTVSFTLNYANGGPSDATGVTIVDTLPAGLTFESASPGCAAAGSVITCTIGTVAAGASGTKTVVVRGAGTGPQTNTATISATTTDPVSSNDTATADVTVDPTPDLAITKTGPSFVLAGGDIPYVLTVTNNGPDPATGVTITDPLPAGTTFVSADAGCAPAGQTVTCAVGALAVGQTATRNVLARALITAGGTAVTNNASASSDHPDPSPGDNVAAASTQIGPYADVSVTQRAPSTGTAGGNATFTIVAHNDGPSTATGVTVTSDLPDGVDVVDVSSAQGTCTVAGNRVTCVLGAMPNGTSVDITVTVKLPVGSDGRTFTSTASVTATEPDPNMANAASNSTVQSVAPPPAPAPEPQSPAPAPGPVVPPGVPVAQLKLTKTAEGVARAGERLKYLITVTNQGPDVATGVDVTDALAGEVVFRSAKSSGVDCSFSKGTIHCPVGKLAVGDSVRINVAVTPKKAGILVNNAVVSSSTTDPDMSDNRAVAAETVPKEKPTKLKVKVSSSSTRVRGGQRLTYTVKVYNRGKQPAVNVDVCDTLPSELEFTSTRGGKLKDAELCFHQDRLEPGKRKVFKVRVRVIPRAKRGTFKNKLSAVADNAPKKRSTATVYVLSDGKVSSSQVRGFTG